MLVPFTRLLLVAMLAYAAFGDISRFANSSPWLTAIAETTVAQTATNKSSGGTLARAMLTPGQGLHTCNTFEASLPRPVRQPKLGPPSSPLSLSLSPPLPSLLKRCNYTDSSINKFRALCPDVQLLRLLQSRHDASEMCCHHVECQPVPLWLGISAQLCCDCSSSS